MSQARPDGAAIPPTLHRDLARRCVVETFHAFDLGEGHVVSVLEPVSGLVQRGDQPVRIDVGHDARQRVFSRGVDDGEVLAKVGEDAAKEAKGVGDDEIDASVMAVLGDGQLVLERGRRQNDDLVSSERVEVRGQAGPGVHRDGCVCIQLGHARSRHGGTRLADVVLSEEELRREVRDGGRSGVVQRQRLDAGQRYVLGCTTSTSVTRGSCCRKASRVVSPISTPSPLSPTISTLDALILFMASWPST